MVKQKARSDAGFLLGAHLWFSHPGAPDVLHGQDRTQSVQSGMPTRSMGTMVILRAPVIPHAPVRHACAGAAARW
ncbi:hypothetical protein CCL24_26200 [Pseudomonas congelans]|nr:hypothetical protein CCL24_26200 [Pseudomonas congelans]PBQ06423.1 hypothetical protein CCL07_11485 [Pseudomonas congelans]